MMNAFSYLLAFIFFFLLKTPHKTFILSFIFACHHMQNNKDIIYLAHNLWQIMWFLMLVLNDWVINSTTASKLVTWFMDLILDKSFVSLWSFCCYFKRLVGVRTV